MNEERASLEGRVGGAGAGGGASGAPPSGQDRAQLARALAALRELRTRLEAVESARREPIAIIGMGCRFPGGADSPEAFWRLLRDGVDAVTEVGRDRWPAEELYDPNPDAPGKAATRWGALLERLDLFDADFFGISPVEARRMDPQQRLLLEATYEALEDAGQPLERWVGGRVGVFVGVHSHSNDYTWKQLRDLELIGMHTATGTAHSIIANRLSYCFDWVGPSLVVETACSSSLVAVHLAVRSLRAGESDMAVAGGVNLVLTPEATVAFTKLHMMASDGRCKTFDSRADGFVRGEGCGVVVLKRLSDALADGDPILALIVGSAVNQDGATNGLTAPSGRSQVAVVRDALEDGGVDPARVTYVETHGTGTALGDPIEVEALAEVLGRVEGPPCVLGSVKTNIGHLEGAAGIAGLIKVVLALQHGEIPKNLHFRELNPHIELEGTRLELATSPRPWPVGTGRYAGVSSFGFGGTNAHVVLCEAPVAAGSGGEIGEAGAAEAPGPLVLPISARSAAALRDSVSRWAEFLSETDAAFPDICRSAALRRTHHEHRLAVVAESASAAAERLREFAAGQAVAEVVVGWASPGGRPGLVFVFTGQGQQWVGMGRDLLESEPVFRSALEACDAEFRPLAGRSLLDDLAADASWLERTDVAQPALFALQVALAELWKSWGIVPDAVVGHSLGEVAAAHVAGALSLSDAIRIVFLRGRLMHQSAGRGRMVAVALSAGEAAKVVAETGGAVCVAAENGPTWTVLSGDADAVEALVGELGSRGVTCRYLPGEYAFHSSHMEPYRAELVKALAGLEPISPRIPMYSTVTGKVIGPEELTAEYWGRNLREPVKFAPAIMELLRAGHGAFVELGAHPALSAMVLACGESEGVEVTVVPSLRRERPGRPVMLQSLGALYAKGFEPAWGQLYGESGRYVSLPRYAWQRRSFWLDGATTARRRQPTAPPEAGAPGGAVKLPGRRLPIAAPTYELRVAPDLASCVKLDGRSAVPAAAYLELALAAAAKSGNAGGHALEDVALYDALRLRGSEPRVLQVSLHADRTGGWRFEIHSAPEAAAPESREWRLHASGRVRPTQSGAGTAVLPADERIGRAIGGQGVAGSALDGGTAGSFGAGRTGLEIEPDGSRHGVRHVGAQQGSERGRIRLSVESFGTGAGSLAALVDAAIESTIAEFADEPESGGEAWTHEVTGLEGLRIHRALDGVTGPLWVEVRDRGPEEGQADRVCDVQLLDGSSATIAELTGLRLRRVERWVLEEGEASSWFHNIAWEEAPELEDVQGAGSVLAASPSELVDRLAARALEAGAEHGLDPARGAGALAEIEALAARYAARAVDVLGIGRGALEVAEATSLAEKVGVQARHRRLFRRVLELARGAGDRTFGAEELAAAADELAGRYPEYAHEFGLLKRCGEALPAVLVGEAEPLELLFAKREKTTAETLYHEAASMRSVGVVAGEAVAAALSSAGPGRPLKILEIGAGTGGTTVHLVQRLPASGVEYVFTDVARTLLERSRARFADYGYMRFEPLDIERPDGPAAAGQYDLVVAANVFHATRDLGETLRNAHRLLAPGGLLMLVEVTARRGWIDLVLGLTEGWWRFADLELRPEHALLGPDAWARALEAAGFEDPVVVGGEAAEGAVLPQALVIGRAPRERRPGCWAVFSRGSKLGDEVIAQLERHGHACVRVSPGDRYDDSDPADVRIAPDSAADYERLFAGPLSADGREVSGVIHLWTAEMDGAESSGLAVLADGVRLGCWSPLLVARALASMERRPADAAGAIGRGPRLWVVTAGAQPVGRPAPTAVFQAPAWGMGRGLALQYPELWGGLVDVSPGAADPEDARRLVREVLSSSDEDQVAYRDGRRWVARVVHADPPAATRAPIDPEAAYLITGGLGGVGRQVARWLVRRGARHVVLTARRPLPARDRWDSLPPGSEEAARVAVIRELEAAGATVVVADVDAGDPDAMAALVGRIESGGRRLGGVIHAAAEIKTRPLTELTEADFASTMHAKARGAWILHELTRNRNADFFVLFSSTAAVFGSRDLAHYAGSNHFLDALAHYRAALGLPALAVNWGMWEVIRALSAKQREVLARSGLIQMDTDLALNALDRLIGAGVVQRTVAHIDWPTLRATYGSRRSSRYFDRIADAPAPQAVAPEPDGSEFMDRVSRLGPAERLQAVKEFVEDAVRSVLGLGRDEPVDPNRGLFDMGMDSLMSVELKDRLEAVVGERLPGTLTLNYPTVATLARYLVDRFFGGTHESDGAVEVAVDPEEAAIAEEVQRLSDEESRRLLIEELKALGIEHDG